ncbi:putative reverse transcriptase domain-containing protein [Tanacetum coccineum]|uniref:Reverse transcriptase domain-containing protein n=1 Tax=Tanacetum coccineum TaxID=301880 RepID=A0ABQ4XJ97_9ASTR
MSVHDIYSFYELESSKSETEEMVEIDIETLTMEQYLGVVRNDQRTGVMRPEIRGNVNFKIKSEFLRELKDDTFFGRKDEDAYEHVEKMGRVTVGAVNSWDLLKKVFILRFCPPSRTAKQLEDIRIFKQEGNETLYKAWERTRDSKPLNVRFSWTNPKNDSHWGPCGNLRNGRPFSEMA